jgi:hypothetical protein
VAQNPLQVNLVFTAPHFRQGDLTTRFDFLCAEGSVLFDTIPHLTMTKNWTFNFKKLFWDRTTNVVRTVTDSDCLDRGSAPYNRPTHSSSDLLRALSVYTSLSLSELTAAIFSIHLVTVHGLATVTPVTAHRLGPQEAEVRAPTDTTSLQLNSDPRLPPIGQHINHPAAPRGRLPALTYECGQVGSVPESESPGVRRGTVGQWRTMSLAFSLPFSRISSRRSYAVASLKLK